MSSNTFVNWAQNAQIEYAAMSIKDQIIVFALTAVITVLALTLAYWAVKGSLGITYYAVYLSLYVSYYSVVLSLLIPYLLLRIILKPLRQPRVYSAQPVKQVA